MNLPADFDDLLDTARELLKTRLNTRFQITLLDEARELAYARLEQLEDEGRQVTPLLCELARRHGLLPKATPAGALDLMESVAQIEQALAVRDSEVALTRVVALHPGTAAPTHMPAYTAGALPRALSKALATLPETDAQLLRLMHGIPRHVDHPPDGREPASLAEVARQLGMKRHQAAKRYVQALVKMRHPSRAKLLRPYLTDSRAQSEAVRETGLLKQLFAGQADSE